MAEETKQKILSISLKLFADRGYHAVSIRDICREVPIKESTLYYYFQNKREIFLVLLKLFEEQAEKLTGGLQRLQEGSPGGKEAFGAGYTYIYFEEYLMDDFCNLFRQVCDLSQLSAGFPDETLLSVAPGHGTAAVQDDRESCKTVGRATCGSGHQQSLIGEPAHGFFQQQSGQQRAGGTDSQKNLSIQQKNSANWPAISRTTGRTRKTAACWDSSVLRDFAELLTIRVTAMREMAGDTRSRITAQEDPGRSRVPDRKNNSVSRTSSMAPKESRETSMLRKNEARTFA